MPAWFWGLATCSLVAAGLHSREALVISAGALAAIGITVWRVARERSRPEPVDGETLQAATERAEEAQVRGGAVLTHIGEHRASVEAVLLASRSGGRLPVFRVRIRLNTPIPFCFTVRRRQSPFLVDALVSNTPLDRPAFE
jgi:hypothetical protein